VKSLFGRPKKRGDAFDGDALEAQIVEWAAAVPLQNSNRQTEASILAGPIEVFGMDAFQRLSQGEQAFAASYCWLGYGLRMAELQLLDDANDPGASGWAAIGVVADAEAASYPVAEDMGPTIVGAARRFCTEEGGRVLSECVPGLPAEMRKRITENWLRMEEGTDNAQLSASDRETLIAYGFAVAAVREYLLMRQQRDAATSER
jgi:hypothetical protein